MGLPSSGTRDPLEARADGWAAGLQLAGLSSRGQEDVAGFVAAFAGSHRYMLDYLAEEVLERQSEQVRAFLLETSMSTKPARSTAAAASTNGVAAVVAAPIGTLANSTHRQDK